MPGTTEGVAPGMWPESNPRPIKGLTDATNLQENYFEAAAASLPEGTTMYHSLCRKLKRGVSGDF